MRATVLALLLCVPLLAGEKDPLARAVELFESPDAARREAGSQLAGERLRELLAPLLGALEHEDPEVRRRARRAILSLVPGEPEQEERRDRAPARAQQVVRLQLRQQLLQQLARRQELQAQALAKAIADRNRNLDNQGARALAAFGVTGQVHRRAPLQPGFLVRKVKGGSEAERLGLRVGDVIVQVDGRAASWPRDFARIRSWKRARFLVLRGKKYLHLGVRNARR